ncbi:SpoIIE family protein phosphatase [Cytophagaceae bacterium ABcell3]|nr:SpoIIE family protein phosphatase [Cytophagaceae bacterium ABcell3]
MNNLFLSTCKGAALVVLFRYQCYISGLTSIDDRQYARSYKGEHVMSEANTTAGNFNIEKVPFRIDIKYIYIIACFILWLGLLGTNLHTLYSIENELDVLVPDFLNNALLAAFFLSVFLAFKFSSDSKRSGSFIEQLWQVFIIGGFTIFLSLFIKFLMMFLGESDIFVNIYITNTIYHLNIGLVIIFLANAFYVWKRMILYQKTDTIHEAWHIFEYIMLGLVLTNFIYIDIFSWPFIIVISPLVVFALILSFNLKWVAFLNYSQKWQSILLIFLIVLISSTFLQQIYEQHFYRNLIQDLADNIFILAVFGFIFINCFSSLLVLFFNLPTSSVFEQKFGEVMLFQKLSQSIQMGNKEEEVYSILIDNSLTTVMADAAWLEIFEDSRSYKAFLNRGISEIDIFDIKKVLRKNRIVINDSPNYIQDLRNLEYSDRLKAQDFRSVLIIPLASNNKVLGNLVLLKSITDGFDRDMVDIISTFVSQASIAIRNFRLMKEAVVNERYKEELKIAKGVQKSLLPENVFFNSHLEISAFTQSSDAIGGDYYDFFEYSREKVAVAIGDVSGHGTSAAFNMAQMKGVFQSLIQLGFSPDTFMVHANNALAKCLEKASFITLSLFVIDTAERNIVFARAGHCPPMFFDSEKGELEMLNTRGIGLGLVRNKEYGNHIEKCKRPYKEGDLLLLYTDGILEAKNPEGEEYDYERLKNIVSLNYQLSSSQITDAIISDVYEFTGTKDLKDDYTFLVIKFI